MVYSLSFVSVLLARLRCIIPLSLLIYGVSHESDVTNT